MVAGGGAPVLSSGGAGSGGAGGCRESERLGAWESLERAFPALSRIIREPEGAWTPGRPEPGQRSAKPATVRNGPKTPYIYRCIQGL